MVVFCYHDRHLFSIPNKGERKRTSVAEKLMPFYVPAVQGRSDVPPGRGGVCGRAWGRIDPNAAPFNSYDDPDVGNPIPPLISSQPAGIHFRQHLLRGHHDKGC